NGAPSIVVGLGSHTIANQVNMNNFLFVTVGNGATLSMTGSINSTVSGRQFSKAGGGLLQIEQINTGTVVVSGGTLRVRAKPTANDVSGTRVGKRLNMTPRAAAA